MLTKQVLVGEQVTAARRQLTIGRGQCRDDPLGQHAVGGRWTSWATCLWVWVECHPLCVLDDHSCYALGLVARAQERTATVRDALGTLFRYYGLPWAILTDNGPS